MKEKEQKLLDEAIDHANRIKKKLPKRVDPAAISHRAKIPFKVSSLMMLLAHRLSDLSEVACYLYSQGNIISAFVITRAIMETAAFLIWLQKRVARVVKSGEVGDLDTFLARALLGSRDSSTPYKAFNVLDAINQVRSRFKLFRKMYEDLSEFCHPNCSGTQAAYGKIDKKRLWQDVGRDVKEIPLTMGLTSLVITLKIFCEAYDSIADAFHDFIRICEEDLEK